MGQQADSQSGGRRPKATTPARGKRCRTVLAALAILAVGVGAWTFWPRTSHWEETTLDLGNDVTMRLVLIPAGKFMMGSPDSEPNRDPDEGPQHEVTISKPFYMGVFEVTQEQYEQVMGTNPSYFKEATNPVETVSWDDAMEFCQKLSEKTGRQVKLPTEAQWEYACRAGTTTPFNTGDDLKEGRANVSIPSSPGAWEKAVNWVRQLVGMKAKAVGAGTLPVGSFPPNGFGLYDMHGNVWDWCADWYGEDYYAASPKVDPQGPTAGDLRVLRGGGWYNSPAGCRSAIRRLRLAATRFGFAPGTRGNCVGFRVVVLPGVDLE